MPLQWLLAEFAAGGGDGGSQELFATVSVALACLTKGSELVALITAASRPTLMVVGGGGWWWMVTPNWHRAAFNSSVMPPGPRAQRPTAPPRLYTQRWRCHGQHEELQDVTMECSCCSIASMASMASMASLAEGAWTPTTCDKGFAHSTRSTSRQQHTITSESLLQALARSQ